MKSVRLEIPFYENKGGKQCMQAVMASILKYFLNKEYSLEELDKLTRRTDKFWTNTSQGALVLHELGLKIKFYSKEDLEPFLEGESFIRKHYGKDADKILKNMNLPIIIKTIKKLLEYNIFKRKIISLREIEEHLKVGHLVSVLIDYNKIINRGGFYQGHFVIVTGFDEENIYYHDSGPPSIKDRKVNKEIFIKAMNANGTDNDCVIVSGGRE